MALKGCQKGEKTSIKDFAHIPWEGTPDFPFHPPQFERNSQTEAVGEGSFWYLPALCGWDLRFRIFGEKWLCQIVSCIFHRVKECQNKEVSWIRKWEWIQNCLTHIMNQQEIESAVHHLKTSKSKLQTHSHRFLVVPKGYKKKHATPTITPHESRFFLLKPPPKLVNHKEVQRQRWRVLRHCSKRSSRTSMHPRLPNTKREEVFEPQNNIPKNIPKTYLDKTSSQEIFGSLGCSFLTRKTADFHYMSKLFVYRNWGGAGRVSKLIGYS